VDVVEAVVCLARGSYYYYYLYTILTVTNAFKGRLPTRYLSVDVCREMCKKLYVERVELIVV